VFHFLTFDGNENPELLRQWREEMTFDKYRTLVGEFYKSSRETLIKEIDGFFTPQRIRKIRPEIVDLTKEIYCDLIDITVLQVHLFWCLELYNELVHENKLEPDNSQKVYDSLQKKHGDTKWNYRKKDFEIKLESIIQTNELSPKEIRFLDKYHETQFVNKFWLEIVNPKIVKETRVDYNNLKIEISESSKSYYHVTNREVTAIAKSYMKKNVRKVNNDLYQSSLTTKQDGRGLEMTMEFRLTDDLMSNRDLMNLYYRFRNDFAQTKEEKFELIWMIDSFSATTRTLFRFLTGKLVSLLPAERLDSVSFQFDPDEYYELAGITDKTYGKTQLIRDLNNLTSGIARFYSDFDKKIVTAKPIIWTPYFTNEMNNMIYNGKYGADAQISSIKIFFTDWVKAIKDLKYIEIQPIAYQLNTKKFNHAEDLYFLLVELYRTNATKMTIAESWWTVKIDTLVKSIDIKEDRIKKKGISEIRNQIIDTIYHLEERGTIEVKRNELDLIDGSISYRPNNYEKVLSNISKESKSDRLKQNKKNKNLT
jgi:hypothetical protein